jgi:hypothetical protein
MENPFSNEPFEIPCPSCKKAVIKPLDWFKKDIVICPFCKATIHTRKFRAKIDEAERNSAVSRKQI